MSAYAHDRYGLALTTRSAEAAASYREGIDRIQSVQPGAAEWLEKAVSADPGFALAHAALAKIDADNGRGASARQRLGRAEASAADATERERSHVAAVSALITGRPAAALDAIGRHLRHHPTDAFVLAPASSVFGLIGFSGRAGREAEQLALLESVAADYGDDWWFLSAHAFALVEVGRWEEGRDLVERSLALRPDNAGAVHVKAHALYEAGADEVATEFLAGWLPGYDRAGALHCHLWWHYCLLLLADGRADEVWPIVDRHLAPDVSLSPPVNVFTDGVSLLWRAALAGETFDADRWKTLDRYRAEQFPRPTTFVDAHAGLPAAALGRVDELDVHLVATEQAQAAGTVVAGDVAVAMTRGFAAYADERWGDVVTLLGPQLFDVVRIGGSRAQRDLAANTVLAALVRDDRFDEAEALIASLDAAAGRQPTRPLGHP